MSVEPFRKLSEYNRWANHRLFAFVEKLNDIEFRALRETFAGSISGVLHHSLIADSLTMSSLTGDEKGYVPRDHLGNEIHIESMVQCIYSKFAGLKVARLHLDQQIVEYLAVVTESELDGLLCYFDFNGERHKTLRWQLLTEMFTHQVHHRGQLFAVLHAMGSPLGSLEYSVFLRACENG